LLEKNLYLSTESDNQIHCDEVGKMTECGVAFGSSDVFLFLAS